MIGCMSRQIRDFDIPISYLFVRCIFGNSFPFSLNTVQFAHSILPIFFIIYYFKSFFIFIFIIDVSHLFALKCF